MILINNYRRSTGYYERRTQLLRRDDNTLFTIIRNVITGNVTYIYI